MSDLVTPTPTRASDAGATASAAAAGGDGAAQPAIPAVAELAGERASPPPATFTAVINIKCPDQTGVVSHDKLNTSEWNSTEDALTVCQT